MYKKLRKFKRESNPIPYALLFREMIFMGLRKCILIKGRH